MSKLRIRRGDKVLGSTDEEGLADWLESGIISEYDLVAVGEESEEWQLIREFVASHGGGSTDPLVDAASDDETADVGSNDDYRPIWDVDDEEPDDDEPVAEIRVPKVDSSDDIAPPRKKKKRPSQSSVDLPTSSSGERRSRSSGSHPAMSGGGTGLDDAEIDALFRRLLSWEAEAPRVRDPAGGKSDAAGRPKKSAKRGSTSGAEQPRKKKRKKGSTSNPDQPRRQRKSR